MKNKISKKVVILISIAIMVLGSVSLFAQYGRGYGAGYGRGYGYGDGYGRGYGRGCGYGAGYGRGYGRGGCGYGYGAGYGRGYGYYGAALTQEQIDQVRSIQDKYFPQMDSLRMEIYNQTQNINAEMRKETPDQNAVNAAIDARSKASADLQKLRSQCFLEIDKVYQNK
ncbi:Spy/CpxP family protein refolding chaperone [Brachyspira hyodysenteriae]|uniref:Spy/CpxP family protein refolding chaperone n=1 Tax=Brachyspira hyodysenteriae TaxID=159 RepID=UPI0022CDD81B|nr:periplasmic heavy metal sensor [Brachyspira hyodysenteriae]MCZ9938715.1 periplasmic heavy metal sensor [Brachyspira hyodysenteriae]